MGVKDQGADATSGRWLTIPRTLSFITYQDDLLLIKRSERARVFPGCYNGVGGHLERDEDVLTGALREIAEETGLRVVEARLRGVIHVDAGGANGILVFVFAARATSREFVPCDEGTLEWVPRDRLPGLPLVEDLPFLLDRVLADSPPFFAHTRYGDQDELIMRFAISDL
jgi:8-oxo-dGTP diphosphatase